MTRFEAFKNTILNLCVDVGERDNYSAEEIEELTRKIFIKKLYHVVQNKMEPMYALDVGSSQSAGCAYRSGLLQPFVSCILLTTNHHIALHTPDVHLVRYLELRITPDWQFAIFSCNSLSCNSNTDKGEIWSDYREYKGDTWPDGEEPIDLEALVSYFDYLCSDYTPTDECFVHYEL